MSENQNSEQEVQNVENELHNSENEQMKTLEPKEITNNNNTTNTNNNNIPTHNNNTTNTNNNNITTHSNSVDEDIPRVTRKLPSHASLLYQNHILTIESHPENIRNPIIQLAKLILRARKLVFFTGAGLSVDSGISTFRGSSGMWSGFFGTLVLGYFGTPFGWNWTPGFAWSKYVEYFYTPIAKAQPSYPHLAITAIADLGFDVHVITQNVDGLHQRSGMEPEKVYELHGTVTRHKCIKNGHIVPEDQVAPYLLPSATTTPKCPTCSSGLRPDCVLFTEGLPSSSWNNAENVISEMTSDDILIIIGCSGAVQPAASLPFIAKKKTGCTVVDINPDQSGFTDMVDISIPGHASQMMVLLWRQLLQEMEIEW